MIKFLARYRQIFLKCSIGLGLIAALAFGIKTIFAITSDPKIISGETQYSTLDQNGAKMGVRFYLNESAYVRVQARDLSGNTVKDLYFISSVIPSGLHYANSWDGRDSNGNLVKPGNYLIYFLAKTRSGNFDQDVKSISVIGSHSIGNSSVTLDRASFNPAVSPLKINLAIKTSGIYRLVAKDENNSTIAIIRDTASFTTGSFIKYWDGKDFDGSTVLDGKYSIVNEFKTPTNSFVLSSSAGCEVIRNNPIVPNPDITYYGTGLASDSLANLQIGRNPGTAISYRFKANKSASLSSALVFLKNNLGKCSQTDYDSLKCYYHGDGGQVKVELRADDGSPSHYPSQTVLATSLVTDPMLTSWRTFPFDRAVNLNKGQLYHLVFTNPSSDPINNFVSINDLGTLGSMPMQPVYSDTDLAVVWKYNGNSAWTVNKNHTPIFSLNYSDGSHQGNGYIDVPSAGRVVVSVTSKARETFTVTRDNINVSKLAVRAQGSGTLKLRLEKSNGILIEEGTVSGSGWLVRNLSHSYSLIKGESYNVVFEAVSGSFEIKSLQEGSSQGFAKESYFSDGFAQKTTSSSWINLPNYDLQFYLQ